MFSIPLLYQISPILKANLPLRLISVQQVPEANIGLIKTGILLLLFVFAQFLEELVFSFVQEA
ncbi:MAG: hypothetical protein A2172_05335 [Candidatus Woykebacteria bacterium RBG_13_40_15]|uniref:Uncharacterized protein n=1 Tax=Candidatus Woykebacteria bacterium RBG_13_40_15 TaxID=1802593 RepID=A0A1G1W839_9BACT|nr:MAG: hypothetical protein A2172_05335 [Candidatus Woykebacteria bacterium RBG_13_40_15]